MNNTAIATPHFKFIKKQDDVTCLYRRRPVSKFSGGINPQWIYSAICFLLWFSAKTTVTAAQSATYVFPCQIGFLHCLCFQDFAFLPNLFTKNDLYDTVTQIIQNGWQIISGSFQPIFPVVTCHNYICFFTSHAPPLWQKAVNKNLHLTAHCKEICRWSKDNHICFLCLFENHPSAHRNLSWSRSSTPYRDALLFLSERFSLPCSRILPHLG